MAPATGSLQSRTSETAEAQMLQPSPAAGPYLVLGGFADRGGRVDGERLHPIDRGLEIGRGRPGSGRGVRKLAVDDRCISSAHARLVATPRGIEILDLESRNGTFVDGTAVQRQQLRE